jgi:hypothetical protein
LSAHASCSAAFTPGVSVEETPHEMDTAKHCAVSSIGPYYYSLKVKFALEKATKAQKWSRGIAPLFL